MSYNEIDPREAKDLIDQGTSLYLLDVREQHEYDAAHIEGVTLIPLGQLEDKLTALDKNLSILCICAGGIRSARAADRLVTEGFTDVTNMKEGMNGWQARNFPVLKS